MDALMANVGSVKEWLVLLNSALGEVCLPPYVSCLS